jgi:hypothetical protein
MKLLLSISLVALATTVYSQSNPYNYLSKNGTEWWATAGTSAPLLFEYYLKGKVRSYAVSEFSAADTFRYRTNTMAANKEVFFDDEGKIVVENYYGPDGFQTWKVVYKDYAQQQTLLYLGFKRTGGLRMADTAKYNDEGLLAYESLYDSSGRRKYAYTYVLKPTPANTIAIGLQKGFTRLEYAKGGKKVYEHFPYGDRKGEYERLRYDGDSTIIDRFNASGKRYEQSVIDRWGHEVSRSQYDDDGVVEQIWRRSYSDEYLIKLEDYSYRDESGKTHSSRTTYHFQSQQLQSIDSNSVKNLVRLTYNEQGDVISIERPGSQSIYTYQYDDRGNWIQREELNKDKPVARWKRLINYY